ncbi:MAG TPA: hypothetical protein VGT40_08055 [Methylomirabilota bacterium]|nr:hypothetical protein [Methylomirabilota bacterium]
MDSYIVRIYRREATKGRALVGVVEKVGAEARRAFNDRDELWRILTAGKKRQRRCATLRIKLPQRKEGNHETSSP